MKNTKLFAVLIVVSAFALIATSCAPKAKEAAAPATTEAAAVDLTKVVDSASFTAAYDTVLAQYADISAKIKAGDTTLSAKSDELVTLAAGLDAAAETIKATLKDKDLEAFTAASADYKAKFAAAVAPAAAAPAADTTTAAK